MSAARPKVLLVDEVPATDGGGGAATSLATLATLLAPVACEPVVANGEAEALGLLRERAFAVMVLDADAPGTAGAQLARQTRDDAQLRAVPALFVTAATPGPAGPWGGYDPGAFDVLVKPVDARLLCNKVQIFIDLYLARRDLANEIAAHQATAAEMETLGYCLSHDLRAPLRPLAGFSEAVLDDHGDKLDDQAKDYLRRIGAAARRMGSLIDDLLELTRVLRADLNPRPVNLAALVETAADALRAADPARQVEVVVAGPLSVRGDARLLAVAIDGLLRNAWSFTRGAEHPRIEVGWSIPQAPAANRAAADGERVFFVRDNGCGFDPGAVRRLFEPFQNLHANASVDGTGISLAVAARIIRRHGGRIWASAAPNQGATFYFTLPSE